MTVLRFITFFFRELLPVSWVGAHKCGLIHLRAVPSHVIKGAELLVKQHQLLQSSSKVPVVVVRTLLNARELNVNHAKLP